MNKKAAIIAGVAIVGLLGAFTLGGKDKAQETEVKGTEIVAVQDENGTIEVTKNPERVVTFDYGTLDILDNMGSEELIANLFRISQTEQKLKRDDVNSESKANKTHYEVGSKIRNTIKELGGTMPEDLPTPDKSLKELEKENKKLKIDDCKYNIK